MLVRKLGVVLVVIVLPTGARAQRISRPVPAGPIGVTLPSPPPVPMPHPDRSMGYRGLLPFVRDWSYAISIDPRVYAPTPAPYPVPYYYRVPVSVPARVEAERPAPPPYDPTRARMLTIGGGADGGGGVMRIDRVTSDSLRVTWLADIAPVRRAALFLADSLHVPLVQHPVTLDHPVSHFTLRGLTRPGAFVGLTVSYADGSVRTTLVPLAR
jgi:hypothetical protein